uniref:Chromo domain-containing protein n=1 Tax=Aegilops tauschii subsp. strangulata TaxID=200361 RepID=A0A453BKD5_AEGTS
KVPDLTASEAQPAAILDRRMMKRGNAPVVQLQIQWDNMPSSAATWEDYDVLRQRFPTASIWEEDTSQGGDNVAPADGSSSSSAAD